MSPVLRRLSPFCFETRPKPAGHCPNQVVPRLSLPVVKAGRGRSSYRLKSNRISICKPNKKCEQALRDGSLMNINCNQWCTQIKGMALELWYLFCRTSALNS